MMLILKEGEVCHMVVTDGWFVPLHPHPA